MTGRIVKIDPLKTSRNGGTAYYRVYFQLRVFTFIDGNPVADYAWAKTDLVTKYRNYARWSPYLKVGNVFSGLQYKKGAKDTIDADSKIIFERPSEVNEKELNPEKIEQLSLL